MASSLAGGGSERLGRLEAEGDNRALSIAIEEVLSDARRSGAPPTFTPEQAVQIVALACEDPKGSGRPVTQWTTSELAQEAVKQGIVPSISPRALSGVFWGEADIKPAWSSTG